MYLKNIEKNGSGPFAAATYVANGHGLSGKRGALSWGCLPILLLLLVICIRAHVA